jgi:hypothetical protein
MARYQPGDTDPDLRLCTPQRAIDTTEEVPALRWHGKAVEEVYHTFPVLQKQIFTQWRDFY